MFVSDIQYRVRYGDTDQMGFVYYGRYAYFYEIGRVEALRNIGVSYKELEEQGIMMPVWENHSYFLQPAQFDDLLTIKVIVKELPLSKMIFNYEIYKEESMLLHHGESVLVFMNKESKKICRPPKFLIDILRPYFS
ncbi:MAG: acyl-CoA thioesterase [Thermoflexibacter sp.]|jgi:acyl-CoA thioester hydrolase|nr:acyl-CoA thioesterase [Thermoflexibacter sp.]